MLERIWRRFASKNVRVSIDLALSPTVTEHGQNINLRNQPIELPIKLFKLALAIGTVCSERVLPITKRNKIIDSSALIERIILDGNNDFKIIIDHDDDDKQIKISQKIGEGISVVVADNLYKLNWSTLSKIKRKGRQRKPDIRCLSHLDRHLVWEAKGSIRPFNRGDKNRAVNQKNSVIAHIRFASFTKLEENSITTVEILDPPSLIPDNDNQKKMLFKADHYAKVFNLIGQKELSEYFNLMRKRIVYDINFPEFDDKVELYNKIKKDYIQITKIDKTFLGNIERIDDNEYVFIGIDRNLISLRGFIDFEDYPEETYQEEGENSFIIMRDGICFAQLKNVTFLQDQLKEKVIPHYQETISIRDIDVMNYVGLNNFFFYLFKKIDAKIERGVKFEEDDYVFDYIVEYKGKKFLIEFKHKIDKLAIEKLIKYEEQINRIKPDTKYQIMVITPQKLNDSIANYLQNTQIKIIDRTDLKKILRQYSKLEDFLSQ